MTAPFWMDENFNHAVRSRAQLHFRNYIRENPAKAHLRAGEWTHWERAEERDTARPGWANGSAQDRLPMSR